MLSLSLPPSRSLSFQRLNRSQSITVRTKRNGASNIWDFNVLQPKVSWGLISINLIGQDVSFGPPLSPSLPLSQFHSVSLIPTGRVVLMANPQRWWGVVRGRGKAPTSVTVFPTPRYKSVKPGRTGTWIRHGAERPMNGKAYVDVFMYV